MAKRRFKTSHKFNKISFKKGFSGAVFFYNPSFAMTPKLAQDNVGKQYPRTR